MVLLSLILVLSSVDMEGFWHSEPDLSEGYASCYFFWENGECAYMESLEEGMLHMGGWVIDGDQLVLFRDGAITLDGIAMGVAFEEHALDFSLHSGKTPTMVVEGEMYYRLSSVPDAEIYSLVPTWGMTTRERDAFSTYD